mgnify:CR=1 FL=1
MYLTDVGFITEEIKNNVAGADTLVLEANHDEEMLKKGIYPYALKQRIWARAAFIQQSRGLAAFADGAPAG